MVKRRLRLAQKKNRQPDHLQLLADFSWPPRGPLSSRPKRVPQFRSAPRAMRRVHAPSAPRPHARICAPNGRALCFEHGVVKYGQSIFPAAIGQNGFVDTHVKREGDRSSVTGRFHVVLWLYRSGKFFCPNGVKAQSISPSYAFGDQPSTFVPAYNRFVHAKSRWSDDALHRSDDLYDVVGILDRDFYTKKGQGSALFLHVKVGDYTAGCFATDKVLLKRFMAGFRRPPRKVFHKKPIGSREWSARNTR